MGYADTALVCSAYCAVAGITATGLHWNKVDTGAPSVETSTVPPGATAAWRFTTAGAAICKEVAPPAGTKMVVGRVWFQAITLPTGATATICRGEVTGSDLSVRVTTGGAVQIKAGSSSVTMGTIAASDGWHYVDFKLDATTAGATVATGKLDGGTEQSAAPDATGSGDITRVRIGQQAASTMDVIIGRIVLSFDPSSAADYPIGKPAGNGSTKGFTPQSTSGTHSTPGSFTLSTGGSPTNGDSSGSLLDEWPPNTTDYIEQTGGSSSDYVEHIFPTSGETATPFAVDHIVAAFAGSAAANTQKAQLYDGTSAADSYALISSGTTGAQAYHGVMVTKPSGGSWTAAALQALRMRWGFSNDTTPAPRMTAALIEVELDDAPAGGTSVPVFRAGLPGGAL